MSLLYRDLCRGAVGYLDSRFLRNEPSLACFGSSVTRSGPFACLGFVGDEMLWAEITSQPGWYGSRLFVEETWRCGGSVRFQTGDQFMNGTVYRGIPDLFLAAGERVHRSWGGRSSIKEIGLERIECWLRQKHAVAFE